MSDQPEKHWAWRVRKTLPNGQPELLYYHAKHGPVTAEFVKTEPLVIEWLDGAEIERIYHPEGMK